MSRVLTLVVVVFLFAPLQVAAISVADSTIIRALDPLLYSHVVVRGCVATITKKFIPLQQLGRGEPGDETDIEVVSLAHAETLRGVGSPKSIAVHWHMDTYKLLGKEVIFCGKWRPGLGLYIVGSGVQCLVETEADLWSRYDGSETITTDELQARLRRARPETVARSARIAVIGRVDSVADSVISVEGHVVTVRKIRLRIEQLLKGQHEGNAIEFVIVLAAGAYAPPWSTATPREFDKGEEWIAFLAGEPGFYYPSSGMNGLLRVEGDTLLYDRVLPIQDSRSKFLKTVEEAISD
jgi:hypothetical protein